MRILLLLTLIPSLAFAAGINQRRPADLQPNSQLLVSLTHPELLENLEHEWRKGDATNGVRCSFSIRSHFDLEKTKQTKQAIYTITQNNPQDSVDDDGEVRDQFTVVLTTEDKSLPLLMLDCFRIYLRSKVQSHPLTLAMVADVVEMPNLFYKPLLSATPSHTFEDFGPAFTKDSRVELQKPLRFTADNDGHRGMRIDAPRFSFGEIFYYGDDTGDRRVPCSASYLPAIDRGLVPYDLTIPVGEMYSIRSYSGLAKSYSEGQDDQIMTINLVSRRDGHHLSISCSSLQHFFTSFEDVAQHLQGVFQFAF